VTPCPQEVFSRVQERTRRAITVLRLDVLLGSVCCGRRTSNGHARLVEEGREFVTVPDEWSTVEVHRWFGNTSTRLRYLLPFSALGASRGREPVFQRQDGKFRSQLWLDEFSLRKSTATLVLIDGNLPRSL